MLDRSRKRPSDTKALAKSIVDDATNGEPRHRSRPVKWCKSTCSSAGPQTAMPSLSKSPRVGLGPPPSSRVDRGLGQVALVGGQPLIVLLGEERAAQADERVPIGDDPDDEPRPGHAGRHHRRVKVLDTSRLIRCDSLGSLGCWRSRLAMAMTSGGRRTRRSLFRSGGRSFVRGRLRA